MTEAVDPPGSAFRLGPHLVTPTRNRIGRGENAAVLPPKVMTLLCVLAARPGETISRPELIERVWHGQIVSDAAIDRAVCNLRKALGDDARHPTYIETVRKRGIRLMIAVEEAAPAPPHAYHRHRFKLPTPAMKIGRGTLVAVASAGAIAVMPAVTSNGMDAGPEIELIAVSAPPAPSIRPQRVALDAAMTRPRAATPSRICTQSGWTFAAS